MAGPGAFLERTIERYVALAARRPLALVLVHALVALACIPPITGLELHTDLAELLPSSHPSVVALRRVTPRQISSTNLVLILSSPDREANHAFLAALRPRLDAMVGKELTEIQYAPETELPAFAARWKWLYASLEDLRSAQSLLERVIAKRKSPLVVDLLGDPDEELRALRKRLDEKLPERNDAPYFEVEYKDSGRSGWRTGVMLWRRGGGLAGLGDRELLTRVEEVVRAAGPGSFHPQMRVEYSGHVPLALAEHDAVRDDLGMATTVCLALVLLSIYLYFGRWSVLLAVGAPAVLGLLVSLAMARYAIVALNANTAFLISIIIGNGINSPIVLFGRYGEERTHLPPAPALLAAMRATAHGTFTATAAASIAYACLLVTSLRGLNQFGLLGGVGMVLCWLATFLLLPPLVMLCESRRPGMLTPRLGAWRAPFRALGALCGRTPGRIALAIAALTLVAVAPAMRYVRDPIEYDLDRLRSNDPAIAARWSLMYQLRMGNVGAGHIARDGVILVDRPEQADVVADALWAKDQALGERSVLREVRTLNKMIPRDQEAKLALLAEVRATIDRNLKLLGDDERVELERWRPPDDLHTLTLADLPRRIRENFTEVDGTVGRFIGIDAEPARYGEGDGRGLIRLSRALEVEALGQRWVAAAPSTIFAGMIETIVEDGPRLLAVAALGVAALVFLALGGRGGLVVLGSVAVGVVWLVALLQIFRLRLNFINFVAVPITLGIGTEYAANLWTRVRREPGVSLATVIGDTGSAVALCSLTTTIGYGSLLLGRNRALQSFGKVAAFGEICCVAAALACIGVWAAWSRRRAP